MLHICGGMFASRTLEVWRRAHGLQLCPLTVCDGRSFVDEQLVLAAPMLIRGGGEVSRGPFICVQWSSQR